MTTIKLTFAAVVLLVVAWTMATIQPMIPTFAAGAAELLSLTVRACVSTCVLVVAATGVWFLLRQQYERDRKRDGTYAVRMVHLQPLPMRLAFWLAGRTSPRVMVDMNASPTPFVGIDHRGVFQIEPTWGHDRQLAYVLDNNKTDRVQAAIAGDAVLGNPLVNLQRGIGGVANAATGRMLAGAYDKPVKPSSFVDANPPAMLPAPELEPQDAVAQSRPASIVMGQTEAGDIVRWEMAQTPHLRFHGMTQGAGKTNAIQTIVAGALATGAHVVVCDRVQFKDWTDFDGRAEFVDTSDPQALADVAARLYNIYLGRTEMLRAAGAKNIARMQQPPQRIVVILSEFGAQMGSARADGVAKEVEYPLTQLARLAAATGIHLIAEDQAVENWPRPLTANMVPVIGRMPAYAGQACGYQGRGGGTDTFPSYTFWCEGVMFRPPHMEPDLPALLAHVGPPQALVMLTPAANVVEVAGSSQPVQEAVHSPFTEQFTAVHTRVPPPPAPVVNYPVNTMPVTVEGWYEWTLDNYLPAHLELLQTDDRGRGVGVKALAETMAAECGKDIDAMKGTASEVAKRLRNEIHTTTGDKLGIDVSHNGGPL